MSNLNPVPSKCVSNIYYGDSTFDISDSKFRIGIAVSSRAKLSIEFVTNKVCGPGKPVARHCDMSRRRPAFPIIRNKLRKHRKQSPQT